MKKSHYNQRESYISKDSPKPLIISVDTFAQVFEVEGHDEVEKPSKENGDGNWGSIEEHVEVLFWSEVRY